MQVALPLRPSVEAKSYGLAVLLLSSLAFTPNVSFPTAPERHFLERSDESKDILRDVLTDKEEIISWSASYEEVGREQAEKQQMKDEQMSNKQSLMTQSVRKKSEQIALEQKENSVIRSALTWQGVPYLYGGKSRAGIDCSALVQTVFKEFEILLPRTAQEQFRVGVGVPLANILPGDLVFFSTNGPGASHVGIYIGDRKFISATRKQVEIQSLDLPYWKNTYRGSRRVLN